jgi:simple sugar transport system permease protein
MRKGLQLVFRHDGQLALIIAAMALIFSVVSPAFLTAGNLVSLLENYSVMAIMAAGLLVVLVSGGIDISFAAIAAVTQYVVALILINAGGNWLVAFALAAAFGGVLRMVNALLIYYLRALSVIVTISTMTCYFSLLMFVTEGQVPLQFAGLVYGRLNILVYSFPRAGCRDPPDYYRLSLKSAVHRAPGLRLGRKS